MANKMHKKQTKFQRRSKKSQVNMPAVQRQEGIIFKEYVPQIIEEPKYTDTQLKNMGKLMATWLDSARQNILLRKIHGGRKRQNLMNSELPA